MAPVKPRRRTARAKVAAASQRGKYAPPSPTNESTAEVSEDATPNESNEADDPFGFGVGLKLNKKDKRTVRHNTLLNRVKEAGISKEKKTLKRRRPAKKLKTDMGGLEDALPDVVEDEWEGISEDEDMEVEGAGQRKRKRKTGEGKMEMKSLKHKPGAMKKKRVMEGKEMERFGKNLAQLMAAKDAQTGKEKQAVQGGGQADRWAALRNFIGGTLEKDNAFAAK